MNTRHLNTMSTACYNDFYEKINHRGSQVIAIFPGFPPPVCNWLWESCTHSTAEDVDKRVRIPPLHGGILSHSRWIHIDSLMGHALSPIRAKAGKTVATFNFTVESKTPSRCRERCSGRCDIPTKSMPTP